MPLVPAHPLSQCGLYYLDDSNTIRWKVIPVLPFFYQPNCDTLDSLTSIASIHINILPVYMYFWLGQWYAIRNKYHVLLFETLLNEWDWYFCNPTLHGLAAYTCGYGDEIQTGALVTIFFSGEWCCIWIWTCLFSYCPNCRMFMISEILLIKVLLNLMWYDWDAIFCQDFLL